MGDTDLSKVRKINNIFRGLSALIDKVAFGLLTLVYRLFFNTSTVDIFSNSTVMEFYSRVQLIIGVFMMFQLVMIVLKGIMNPDSFTDSKTGGFNVITRISIALIMFAFIIPINIENPQNKYQAQINNNGLLFGTLYSLQYRILSNNTIGKLVLGKDVDTSGDENDENSIKYESYAFSSTILKAFYRINLAENSKNHMCADYDYSTYNKVNVDPKKITDLVNDSCKDSSGTKRYAFAYSGFISFIVGFFFVAIVLSFTIDIAVRMIKLAILRLIAPIPIISYMDPKGSKDGAFNAWVKTLTTTYLDLFIRLAVVYFVLFIIKDTIQNGIIMEEAGEVGVLTKIIVWAGLLIFAKESPKFLRQALGLKDEPFKLFGGLSSIMGLGAAAVGTVGSARTNYAVSKGENAALHPDQTIRNGMRNVGSAIVGAIAGAGTGFMAATGKDASIKKVLDAQSARNAKRGAHSTLPGRVADYGYGMFTGTSLASKGNNILQGAQDWVKAQGAFKKALEGEATKNGAATNLGTVVDSAGHRVNLNTRYEELERAVASAHDGVVTINGVDYDANQFTTSFMEDALKNQVRDYQVAGHSKQTGVDAAGNPIYADKYDKLISVGQKLYKVREDAIRASGDVDVSGLDPAIAQNFTDYRADYDNIDRYGKAIGAANVVISNQENDMRQRMRRANNQQKK